MKISKIYKAIKHKKVIAIVKIKMQNAKRIFYIKDKAIRNLQMQQEEYKRLSKKYTYVLQEKKESKEKTKSNKIWICWFQGIEEAPTIVQKCVSSIKKQFKNKEIVILDLNNYSNYADIPLYIKTKFEKNMITYTHFSDILRATVLAEYGGIWLDATVLCTGKIPKYITESELFVYKNIDLDKEAKRVIVASSWLISANAHNEIIEATRDLLFEYWKKEKILYNYFLFHIFFKMATEKYKEQWNKVPTFNNVNPHMLQFELLKEYNEERFKQLKEMSTIHKLDKNVKNVEKEKYTFLDYILKEY